MSEMQKKRVEELAMQRYRLTRRHKNKAAAKKTAKYQRLTEEIEAISGRRY